MAQVMQWPPAIWNYMRRVRLKYQHVIAIFPNTDSKSEKKKNACMHTTNKMTVHKYINITSHTTHWLFLKLVHYEGEKLYKKHKRA